MSWNGSDGKSVTDCPKGARRDIGQKAGKRVTVGLLTAVVAIVGVGVYFAMRDRSMDVTKKNSDGHRAMIAEVTPSISTNAVQKSAVNVPSRQGKSKSRREAMKGLTSDQRYEYIVAEFKNRRLPEASSNRYYRTSIEQTMGWVFTTRIGAMPPPLPPVSVRDREHLAEILISDIPIADSDDEVVKDHKEMLRLAKKEMIEFIKQGGEPEEFLEYYHDQLKQANMKYNEARRSVIETVRENPDIAEEYIKRVNAQLKEQDIMSVRLPTTFLEEHGVHIEKEQEDNNEYD